MSGRVRSERRLPGYGVANADVRPSVSKRISGTCLNFFGLADRLRIGRVTDVLEVATRLAGAGSVVRP